MTLDELLLGIKSISFNEILCQTEIQTKEDKSRFAKMGYCFPLTEAEVKAAVGNIDSTKIFYTTSPSLPSFYYNEQTLAVCTFNVMLIEVDANFGKYIKDVINKIENEVAKGDFSGCIFTLPDAMRFEYFEKVIEKFPNTKGLYSLFFRIYENSDYGFANLKPCIVEQVIARKTDEDFLNTAEAIKDLPNTLTVYRGGSCDISAPAEQAFSWTTNINIAYFFACRRGKKEAYVVKGEVEKDRVIEALFERGEAELIVRPSDVKILESVEIWGIDKIESPMMKIIPMYHQYRDAINKLDFAQNSNVHGKLHEQRVLLLALLLAELNNLPMSDRRVLATAAIYHDTMRTTDGCDTIHGKASAAYYNRNVSKANPLTAFIIEYHSKPDDEGYLEIKRNKVLSKNRTKSQLLFEIFKDADALDRIRFGLKDLDVMQLRNPFSKHLPLIARLNVEQIK